MTLQLLPSPNEVETWLSNFEKKAISRLATISRFGLIASVLYLTLLLTILMWGFTYFHFRFIGVIGQIYAIRHALPFLPIAALVGLFINKKWCQAFSVITCCGLWLVASLSIASTQATLSEKLDVILIVPISLFLIWLIANKTTPARTRVLWILFWLISLGLIYLRLFTPIDVSIPLYFWLRFKIMFIFLFAISATTRDNSARDFIWIPMNVLRGEIWPDNVEYIDRADSKRLHIWWQGVLNLNLTVILIAAETALYKFGYSISQPHWVWSSVLTFYAYVIGDIAYCNLAAGSARLFGYKVPDATSFALLARDPGDWWQRISWYNYAFISEFVFFPALRRLRNPIFASFFAFMLFYFLHFATLILLPNRGIPGAAPEWTGSAYKFAIINTLVIFLIWFGLIILGRVYWPLKQKVNEPAIRGWFSVFLTHILFITTLIIAPWITRGIFYFI